MKKSPVQSQNTYNISEQERTARNTALEQERGAAAQLTGFADQAKQGLETVADRTAESVNPALERFYDPSGAGMSAWKKGQLITRTGSTNQAYDAAKSKTRMRARMSGFGYEQPFTANAEEGVDIAKAGALSRIPGDVEAEAIPIEMQAIGQRMQSGQLQGGLYGEGAQLQQNAYGQAAGVYGDIAGQYSPENYYQLAAQQREQEQARKGGLWKNIARIGLTAAAPFTRGATLPLAGAIK